MLGSKGNSVGLVMLIATALISNAATVALKPAVVYDRSHFFGVAAHLIRRILLMHARQHHAAKRGGSAQKISLDEAVVFTRERSADLLALDELLTRLVELDPQQARIVELRFFGGLSVEETADLLGISTATVKRDWAMAKAWLARELGAPANRESGSG